MISCATLFEDIYEYSNIPEAGKMGDYVVTDTGYKIFLNKNGNRINFTEANFPIAIIANSIMLTDKYPFFRKDITPEGEKVDAFPNYKYLGVRNIAQNASTRAYVRKTVEFIVQEFSSFPFRAGLARATKFLELAEEINIFYYTSNTPIFFKGKLDPIILGEYFEKIREKYPKPEDGPPFKLNQYLKIKEHKELILNICNFCNKLFNENRLIKPDYKHSSTRKIIYNLFDHKSFELLNEEFSMLEHLRQLGMISAPEIQLKREDGYSLQESSSGEYHFFSSIVGLLATVKINSLVFIDEPEISLHPNWQMKYLTFLRELFSIPEYATSHILVATHSHFLISDMCNVNSKLIGLKREGGIQIVDLPKNTFGWSAEEVLLKVFKVTTTRNYYVAEKLGLMLDFIADEKSTVEMIKAKFTELELGLLNGLTEDDPLKTVIDTIIKEYVS
jgi:hypothetical protein